MGTRSNTAIFADHEREEEIINLYRQMDSFPDTHGQEIVDILSPYRIVNGMRNREENLANGMGDLAIQFVTKYQNKHRGSWDRDEREFVGDEMVGSPYLKEYEATLEGVTYLYEIYPPDVDMYDWSDDLFQGDDLLMRIYSTLIDGPIFDGPIGTFDAERVNEKEHELST